MTLASGKGTYLCGVAVLVRTGHLLARRLRLSCLVRERQIVIGGANRNRPAVLELSKLLAEARRTASSTFSLAAPAVNPIAFVLISRDPALDVRINTTSLKSAFRPVLSVSVA